MLWGSLRLERRHWRAWSGTLAGMTWGDGGESSATYSTLDLNLTLFFVNYDSSTPSAPGREEWLRADSLARPSIDLNASPSPTTSTSRILRHRRRLKRRHSDTTI